MAKAKLSENQGVVADPRVGLQCMPMGPMRLEFIDSLRCIVGGHEDPPLRIDSMSRTVGNAACLGCRRRARLLQCSPRAER